MVFEWLKSGLRDGTLTTGDRLPSERTLTQSLSVSRTAVREAMRILEAIGIVVSVRGSGDAAGTFIRTDPERAFELVIQLHTLSSDINSRDIVQTRVMIETWAAVEFRIKPDLLAHMQALLEAMDQPELTAEKFLDYDAEFHRTLVRSADNKLAFALMSSLRQPMEDSSREFARDTEEWAAVAEILRAQHWEIFESLSAGNRERAAEQIQNHINGFFRKSLEKSKPR